MNAEIEIYFPRTFTPLPPGYSVLWLECIEHYMGFGPDEAESSIFSSRFAARKWCFAHFKKYGVRS